MNIYYVSLYYKKNHVTGANKRYDEIGKRLLSFKNTKLICIVTENNKPSWCPSENCFELPEYNSILTRLYIWFRLQIFLISQPKGIIVNDFMPIPILSKIKGHKEFQLIHDLRNFNEFKRGGLGIFTSLFQKIQLRLVGRIVTVSDYSSGEISRLCGVESNKILTSYNGVDKKEYKSIDRDIDVLYVATFEPRKNHINLIKAICLSDKPLNIVFVGSDLGMKDDIVEMTARIEKEAGHQFHFYEQLTEVELSDVYLRSKVFCSPSLYEGFGIPIIEAILYKCHVVCSDIPVFREITLDKCIYFDALDSAGIFHAIKSNLHKESVDDELVKMIADRFNWDSIAEELYSHLIN